MEYMQIEQFNKKKRPLSEAQPEPKTANVLGLRVRLDGTIAAACRLVRDHPIPYTLCAIAPFMGIFGFTEIGVGMYVGAALYAINQLVDQFAYDEFGEDE